MSVVEVEAKFENISLLNSKLHSFSIIGKQYKKYMRTQKKLSSS
jgi:hypothetical protein